MAQHKKNTNGKRNKMSVRTGDEVVVIAGKDKGKRGRVIRVIPAENRVVVENINIVKRHLRRQPGSLQAGIIEKPAPLHRSNVMVIDPRTGEPTRIGHTVLPDGTRARVSKKSGEILTAQEQR